MITLSAFADEIGPNPAEQLDVLERNGVRCIEFRSILGKNVLDLSQAEHESFRTLLRERGFGLSAIGSPIGKAQITDPFEAHLKRFEIALSLAEFYETPRIRVFSFYIPAGRDPKKHRDEVMRRMESLSSLAADRNIVLMLENEKGIYGDNADRVLDILQTVDSPSLGHAFDSANYLEIGESIDRAWELLKTRVKHFHVKDYDIRTRKNVVCGAGQGQIPRLIADAVASGYEGYAVLEPHLVIAAASHGFTGPERFADAATALKKALDDSGVSYR